MTQKSKPKVKAKPRNNPTDKKLSLTQGQLGNIIAAAELLAVQKNKKQQQKLKENGCCPAAKTFVRQVKQELRNRGKRKK